MIRHVARLPALVLLLGLPALAHAQTSDSAILGEEGCQPHQTARHCYEHALTVAVDSVRADRDRGDDAVAVRTLTRATALMRHACSRGESAACYHYARLTDEGLASDTAQARRSADLYEEACTHPRDPVADACHRIGDAFSYGAGRPLDNDLAMAYYERGCALDSGSACQKASVRYDERTASGWTVSGLSQEERRRLAREYAERGCALGSPNSCVTAGWHRGWGSGAWEDLDATEREELRALFTFACESGNTAGCNNLGALFNNGAFDVPAPQDSARHYHRRACMGSEKHDLRNGLGCKNLGEMFAEGRFGRPEPDSARLYFEIGCELREHWACWELADIRPDSIYVGENLLALGLACFESGEVCAAAGYRAEAVLRDLDIAALFYLRGCSAGDGLSCSNRAGLFANAGGWNRALKYARLGCDLDEPRACRRMVSYLERYDLDEARGHYRVRACELDRSADCLWQTISIAETRGGPPPLVSIPVSIDGRLVRGLENLYAFEVVGGASVVIDLQSADFDAYLRVGRAVGPDSLQVIAFDDDGGEDLDARLTFTAPEPGQYVIQAGSYRGTGEGDYVLKLEPLLEPLRRPGLLHAERWLIQAGQERSGELGLLDARLEDASPYHEYVYTGEEGERVEVTLISEAFDPFLVLGRPGDSASLPDSDSGPNDLAFVELARADAHPDDPRPRARLVVTLREAGEYIIRVNTFGPMQGGPYTLKVERVRLGERLNRVITTVTALPL